MFERDSQRLKPLLVMQSPPTRTRILRFLTRVRVASRREGGFRNMSDDFNRAECGL
jgi:hypothetical protein